MEWVDPANPFILADAKWGLLFLNVDADSVGSSSTRSMIDDNRLGPSVASSPTDAYHINDGRISQPNSNLHFGLCETPTPPSRVFPRASSAGSIRFLASHTFFQDPLSKAWLSVFITRCRYDTLTDILLRKACEGLWGRPVSRYGMCLRPLVFTDLTYFRCHLTRNPSLSRDGRVSRRTPHVDHVSKKKENMNTERRGGVR